jgi:hypothetical protein
MRGYIFTKRENRIIRDFLDDRIEITHRGLSQIRTRLKGFEPTLLKDIALLIRLRNRLAESASTVSI